MPHALAATSSVAAAIQGGASSVGSQIAAAGRTISGALSTPWEPWLSAAVAVGTILSAVAAALAALQAKRSADASLVAARIGTQTIELGRRAQELAERVADEDQVRALVEEFEAREYFIRFKVMSKITKDMTGVPVLGTKLMVADADSAAGTCLQPFVPESHRALSSQAKNLFTGDVKDVGAEAMIREMLGPPWSIVRADLATLYYYALKIASFCLDEGGTPRSERVRMLNASMGGQLVTTLVAHRALAARLFKGAQADDSSYEQFRIPYGLRNPSYAKLVDALAFDAKQHELLTPLDRKAIDATESYLSRTPVDNPMRESVFDSTAWSPEPDVEQLW